MSTMLFGDEIVEPDTIDELGAADESRRPTASSTSPSSFIESLAGPFDPDKYRDEYRDEVLTSSSGKAAGEEIAVQPAAEEEDEPVPDLMAALKASLDAVREKDGGARRPRRSRRRRRPKRKAPAAKKKAPAKAKRRLRRRRGPRTASSRVGRMVERSGRGR